MSIMFFIDQYLSVYIFGHEFKANFAGSPKGFRTQALAISALLRWPQFYHDETAQKKRTR